MEKVNKFFLALIGAFFSFFGMLAIPLLLLIGANITDWITGILACKYRGERLTSEKSFNGIMKKMGCYILVFIGFMVDVLIQYCISNLGLPIIFPEIFACITAVWLVCSEIISILENLIDMGVPMPPFLKPIIERILHETECKIEINKIEEDK